MTRHERVLAQGRALKRCHAMYQEAIGEPMDWDFAEAVRLAYFDGYEDRATEGGWPVSSVHQDRAWRCSNTRSTLLRVAECHGCGITSCCEGACGGPGEVTNGPVPTPWEWA